MNNYIQTIHPYRVGESGWSFDSEEKGLQGEALVLGTEKVLSSLVPADVKECTVHFCAEPFPGTDMSGAWLREELGGNWYETPDGRDFWLCPSLFLYFDEAPVELHMKVEFTRKPWYKRIWS